MLQEKGGREEVEGDRERGRRGDERWWAALCGSVLCGAWRSSISWSRAGERLTLRYTLQAALQLSERETARESEIEAR